MDFLLEEDAERLTKYYCSRCDIEWCGGPHDEFHREFCPYYKKIMEEWHKRNLAEIEELDRREIELRKLR